MIRSGFDAIQFDDDDAEAVYEISSRELSEFYQPGRRHLRVYVPEETRQSLVESGPMSALAMVLETPEQKVERLNAELRGKSPQEIIRAALREFGRRLTYVSSFGAESAAMLSFIAEVDPGMPIVFIDTGMHFHQTLQYRATR